MSAKYVFPKALKELRFHLSQSASSNTLRSFLTKNYPALKQSNPNTPILIREALGVRPTAFARFERGVEHKVHLDQVAEADLASTLKALIEKH
ncbi:hypothetical protein TRVA0_001S08262 [Trichomonascus vanleenenianus]|uniref:L51/S25/CI-B8 domain-containing protein n=1 Tax=Trichomonascus vanleenenianus TaxID=2268995 RepID=UPI003ECAB113